MMNFNTAVKQRYSEVDIFSTEGRIDRRSYFVYSIILPFFAFSILASFAGALAKLGESSSLSVISNSIAYLFLGLAIISLVFITIRLTIQRCHDFNASGWFALFAAIPLASFIFAIIPGNNGLNCYGEEPKAPSIFVRTGVVFLALIFIALLGYGLFSIVTNPAMLEALFSFIS